MSIEIVSLLLLLVAVALAAVVRSGKRSPMYQTFGEYMDGFEMAHRSCSDGYISDSRRELDVRENRSHVCKRECGRCGELFVGCLRECDGCSPVSGNVDA